LGTGRAASGIANENGERIAAALEQALGKGRPEIFNTDQGAQFTSEAFTGLLLEQDIQVSMDGKGRYRDKDGVGCEG